MDVPPTRPDGTPASFTDNLNPDSLEVIEGAFGEPCLAEAKPGERYQFERLGYFVKDIGSAVDPDSGAARESETSKLVFNKTVGLRDTWAKIENAHNNAKAGA
jgi:glutaminyl-tRNA synthetase